VKLSRKQALILRTSKGPWILWSKWSWTIDCTIHWSNKEGCVH
jgi:hypothetical protein